MEKKPYNKIDDFFSNAFGQEGEGNSASNWNVPSDEVWEKLLEHTEKEKKRRPVLLYWKWAAVAAGVALILLAGQSIQYRNQLRQQAKKIEWIEQKLQDQQVVDNTDKAKNESESKINKNEIANTDDEKNMDVLEEKTLGEFRKHIVGKEGKTGENVIKSNTAVADSKDTITRATPFLGKDEMAGKIAMLPVALPILSTPITLLENTIPTPVLSKNIKPYRVSPKPYVAVNYAFADAPQKFDNRRQPIFNTQVSEERTINLGMRFAYPIKDNWFVESGLQYSKSTAQREHRPPTRFRRANERPNNRGELESTYNLSLSSAEYTIETDVVLSRSTSGNNISDGRDLDLKITTSNSLQQLSVPILLVHQLKYHRLSLAMKAGVAANFRLNDKVMLEEVRIGETSFTIKDFSTPRIQAFQQRNTAEWSYHLSTTLAYQFNQNWSLQIEPYFNRSITSRSTFQRNPIYAHAAGVQVGVKYAL